MYVAMNIYIYHIICIVLNSLSYYVFSFFNLFLIYYYSDHYQERVFNDYFIHI